MSNRRAVIWGASGSIGRALVDALAVSGDYATIHAGSRAPVAPAADIVRPFTFDLLDEASIAAGASAVTAAGPVDLVIVATGMLHSEKHLPEKRFAALTADAMTVAFQVNTVGPALIAKHMIQALPRDRRSVFAGSPPGSDRSATTGSVAGTVIGHRRRRST